MTNRHTQTHKSIDEKIEENEIDRFDHSIKRHISRENDPLIDSFTSENNGLFSHLTPDSCLNMNAKERMKERVRMRVRDEALEVLFCIIWISTEERENIKQISSKTTND